MPVKVSRVNSANVFDKDNPYGDLSLELLAVIHKHLGPDAQTVCLIEPKRGMKDIISIVNTPSARKAVDITDTFSDAIREQYIGSGPRSH